MSEEKEDLDEEGIREDVSNFLRRNFPQIQMHGGSAEIAEVTIEENGEVAVSVQLGGACSGCGISPMTIQAIKSRMTKEIDEVDRVHANTMGGEGLPESTINTSTPTQSRGSKENDVPDAPF